MPDPIQTAAPTSELPVGVNTDVPAPSSFNIGDIAQGIMSSGTAKGAAMGALFSELLRQSGQSGGVLSPVDFSKYAMPARETTVAAPRYVPYAEYGARDIPAMSPELMQSFGAPAGLGNMMPTSQYTAMPAMASRAPMTFTSPGSGQNLMPTLNITPRSNRQISPLTGALLGGALGYLTSPSSASSDAGSRAMSQLYGATTGGLGDLGKSLVSGAGNILSNIFKKTPVAGGNVGPNVPTGSGGEAYYEQGGKTYAINPDGTTRLVYDPVTGEGSAGGYDSSEFGGDTPTYTLPSDYSTTPYQPSYTYQPTFAGGTETGNYYPPSNTSIPIPDSSEYPSSDSYYGDYSDYGSFGFKSGGMATPLMADGGMAGNPMQAQPMQDQPPPSFYTYGTVIDPMDMMTGAQTSPMQQAAPDTQNMEMQSPIEAGAAMNPIPGMSAAPAGMARGGVPQGGLHVPTVQGRHDYRAGSRVMGPGDGQSDDIPAMLADGEYVFDADTVAQLGNGSSKAGSDMLDRFREEIRSHKRSAPVNKIPPASKSPLQYLKQAQSRSNKNG